MGDGQAVSEDVFIDLNATPDSQNTNQGKPATKGNNKRTKRGAAKKPNGNKTSGEVIDLTSDFSSFYCSLQTSSIKCAGCESFFVSTSAHDSHRIFWQKRGQNTHTVDTNRQFSTSTKMSKSELRHALRRASGEKISKINKRKERRLRSGSGKASRRPSVVVEKQTIGSLSNNSNFTDSYMKDASDSMAGGTKFPQTYVALAPLSDRKVVPLNPEPSVMTLLLHSVKYAILFDLDNMAGWCDLKTPVKDIFLWGFYGVNFPGLKIWDNPNFAEMVGKQRLWLTACGAGSNSADFGMSFHTAQLSMLLPPSVPFIIVSSDHDLFHTMGHLLSSGRRTFMIERRLNLTSIEDMIQYAENEIQETAIRQANKNASNSNTNTTNTTTTNNASTITANTNTNSNSTSTSNLLAFNEHEVIVLE